MSFGFGLAFPRYILAAKGFSPASLFSLGEQGAWYDPSDINLTWRRNLLTYTEQFENAAWTKQFVDIAVDSTTAPDGTLTADLFTPDTTTNIHQINRGSLTVAASMPYTASVYVKPNGYTKFTLIENAVTGAYAAFDCTGAGSVLATGLGGSGTIEAVANGFYRLTLTLTTTAAQSVWRFDARVLPVSYTTGAPTATWVGDGTSGIYVWGAQLEVGSTASAYQQIVTPAISYLTYQPLPILYEDAAGTTPVTGVELPVGLMLDKSKGLVLGSELVTNGDFSSATGWTGAGDSFSISGGIATLARTTTFTYYQGVAFSVTAGKSYWITGSWLRSSGTGQATVQVRDNAGGVVRYQQDASPGSTFQSFRYLWIASATESVYVRVGVVNAAATVQVDLVSIQELAGNHAYQTTSADRPTLSARYNLLTKTEQFDDAVWTKDRVTVTANSTTAPDGTLTADTLTDTAVAGEHRVFALAVVGGIIAKTTIYAKAGTASFVSLSGGTTASGYATFDLSSGTVAAQGNATGTITNAGGGWYRCQVSGGTSNAYFVVNMGATAANAVPGGSYVGTGLTVQIWGADYRAANILGQPAYQRVNTATDYDTVGFSPYLRFNGTNSWMQTASINFAAGATNPPLGSELVTNGDFSQGSTGWSDIAGGTVSSFTGGQCSFTTSANFRGVYQAKAVAANLWLKINFDIVSVSGGTVEVIGKSGNDGISGATTFIYSTTTAGSKTAIVFCSGGTSSVSVRNGSSGTTTVIDNISVRELTDTAYAPDKMTVFAGVRKLASTTSCIYETSADAGLNNGAFCLLGDFDVASKYQAGVRGTSYQVATTAANYASPITNVLTQAMDISGTPRVALRANGELAASNSSSAGTGTFGNYPLYIGRRGGTTLPFSGQLYSLIVRGALSTDAQISSTEGYVETKTFNKDMSYVYSDELTTSTGDAITTASGDSLFMTATYQ